MAYLSRHKPDAKVGDQIKFYDGGGRLATVVITKIIPPGFFALRLPHEVNGLWKICWDVEPVTTPLQVAGKQIELKTPAQEAGE